MRKIMIMLIGFIISSLALATFALAIPGIPNVFYGDVFVNGEPAANDLLVTAKIDGVQFARSYTIDGTIGANALNVPADNPSTDLKDGGVVGDLVEFYVEDTFAASAEFENGAIVEIELKVALTEETLEAAAADPNRPSSSGGTSGAPVVSGSPEEVVVIEEEPEDEDVPPPAPASAPEEAEEEAESTNGLGDITGNVLGEGGVGRTGLLFVAVILGVVLLAVILWNRRR